MPSLKVLSAVMLMAMYTLCEYTSALGEKHTCTNHSYSTPENGSPATYGVKGTTLLMVVRQVITGPLGMNSHGFPQLLLSWFGEFNDQQRNMMLLKLLVSFPASMPLHFAF